jgi:hypothetical protein
VQGQSIEPVEGAVGLTRIYGPDRLFLGLVEINGAGQVVPRRLRAQPPRA